MPDGCPRARWRGCTRTRCRASPTSTWCWSPAPAAGRSRTTASSLRLDTYSAVSLDQLFDTLDPPTRAGLRGFIRGEAASIEGRAPEGNQTLRLPSPGADQHQQRDRRADAQRADLRCPARAGRAGAAGARLARPGADPAGFEHGNATTGAIASQSQALEQALSLLAPGAQPLDRDVCRAAIHARHARSVGQPSRSPPRAGWPSSRPHCGRLTDLSIPTVGNLSALIRNPSGGGDLISLLQATPSLARLAEAAFPRADQGVQRLSGAGRLLPRVHAGRRRGADQPRTDGAYYDANGHYARTQPWFGAFGVGAANQLVHAAAVPALRRPAGGADALPGRGGPALAGWLIAAGGARAATNPPPRRDHEAPGEHRDWRSSPRSPASRSRAAPRAAAARRIRFARSSTTRRSRFPARTCGSRARRSARSSRSTCAPPTRLPARPARPRTRRRSRSRSTTPASRPSMPTRIARSGRSR